MKHTLILFIGTFLFTLCFVGCSQIATITNNGFIDQNLTEQDVEQKLSNANTETNSSIEGNTTINKETEPTESLEQFLDKVNGYWVDLETCYSYEYGTTFFFYCFNDGTVYSAVYPGSGSRIGEIVQASQLQNNQYKITVHYPEVEESLMYDASPEEFVILNIEFKDNDSISFANESDKNYVRISEDWDDLLQNIENYATPIEESSPIYEPTEPVKPIIVGYKTVNAMAYQHTSGEFSFATVCPYCHDDKPTYLIFDFKNGTEKCRFSNCPGRQGYNYTIEAIYD